MLEEIERKLTILREKWKSGFGDRETIKRQARALEIAKEKVQKRSFSLGER